MLEDEFSIPPDQAKPCALAFLNMPTLLSQRIHFAMPKRQFRFVHAGIGLMVLLKLASAALGSEWVPEDGRWSVALGWSNAWPNEWQHRQPMETERVGEWTIHRAEFALPDGTLKVQDSERQIERGLTEVRRRWQWTGQKALSPISLSVRVATALPMNARPILPGISYYDNPAGQSIDPSRIPVISAARSVRRGFYEEHRFPMPFAAVEGDGEDGLRIVAIHSTPSPIRFGHVPDQWWSLGVDYTGSGVELALHSGAVASNGRNGIIKGYQRRWFEYPDAWCSLPAGAVVEKTFFIERASVAQQGAGFQQAVHSSIRLNAALNPDGFPPVRDVLERKFSDTLARWRETPHATGIQAFPEHRRWIDLGWAGQSEAFAYPFLVLGDAFGLPDVNRYVQRGLDFIASAPFDSDGFPVRFDLDKGEWLKRTNPLSQAQAMENMLQAFRVARGKPGLDVSRWETFLRRAADLHAARVLAPAWRPISTNEGFLIAPLVHASTILTEPRYLEAARKAADHYLERHQTMAEPYWGGTLDARCEDKEGAWAAFQGFLAMYEVTHEIRYLQAATHAADVVLSYMYVWDVPLPAGRLSDHGFKTRGWTAVSVQNMHLDVYGVLCAPAFWRLGQLTDRSEYQHAARLLYVTCGQLLDPRGGQGEQIHQTNYAQHYDYDNLAGVRGDYVEQWNVYWISAHFLVAAAQFREMGVDVTAW